MTVVMSEDTEVRRAKRSWPAQYKLDVLNEIDSAQAAGQPVAVGEICRREGLYSSLLTQWRHQRDAGALEGLTD
jgi:transposase